MRPNRYSSAIIMMAAASVSLSIVNAQDTGAPVQPGPPQNAPPRVIPPDNSNQPMRPETPALPNVGTSLIPDVLARLEAELSKRREVTLTGQLLDVPTFFLTGPPTNTGALTLQGQPISAPPALLRKNAAKAQANPPTPVLVPAGPGNVENSLVPLTPAPNPNVAQEPGHVNINPAPPAPGPPPVSGTLMILRTGTYTYLAMPDPTLVNNTVRLTPSAASTRVRGKILEHGGMRLLLVNAVEEPNGQIPIKNPNNQGATTRPAR